jgi:hypothetical protein
MRKLHWLLVFAVIVGLAPQTVRADGNEGIPLSSLAGTYVVTVHGSLALCTDANFQEAACSEDAKHVLPLTVAEVGVETIDSTGNACTSYVETLSDLPPDFSAPIVVNPAVVVSKTTKYDPTTGQGDTSVTGYNGGSCNGATFNSSGATLNHTATTHFVVVSDKKLEVIVTSVTDPTNGIGDFSVTATAIRR